MVCLVKISTLNNNHGSRDRSGYYQTSKGVFCGMTYTGSSCENIFYNNPAIRNKPGYYRINDNQWTYCNMSAIANKYVTISGDFITTCAGVKGRWRRIANVNISAGDDCPREWRKATQSGISFCRVARSDTETCSSASFSTNGISYHSVCGRARGYQKGHPLAFYGSQSNYNKAIDDDYVSGLSITHGSNPRQHIWTYASGHAERYSDYTCPCSLYNDQEYPPSFVGFHYYCESGSTDEAEYTEYYFNDTLWDGKGCVDDCCNGLTQPWFYRQLDYTTQDNIEARIA